MFTLAFLGRSIYLPPNGQNAAILAGLLFLIGFALWRFAGWPTAAMGIAVGLVSYVIDQQPYLPATIALVSLLALYCRELAPPAYRGWRPLRELLLLGGGFLLYERGRAAFIGDAAAARRNAQAVLDFERRLHAAFELPLQRPFLDHEGILRFINGIYSWAYLPFVLGTLLWLFLVDDSTFRLMRTSLGISAVLALVTMALLPVAPPRLLPASGLVDTHALLIRVHSFVNPYAAIPSFHVGWTTLSGVMLFLSLRSRWRWLWLFGPVSIMTATVVITGNHFWVDGVLGVAYTLLPAYLVSRNWHAILPTIRQATRSVRASAWASAALLALGGLLLYLLVREAVDPGFTHYWGYIVAQISATIVVLIVFETRFQNEGGLSWLTYTVVVLATWADTLGTAGHLYDRYSGYDKIIHFGGGLAITAAMADVLVARRRQIGFEPRLWQTLAIAFAVAIVLNVGWEVYEYLGDRVFATGRDAGRWDTTYDLMCDTAGALFALVLLRSVESRRIRRLRPDHVDLASIAPARPLGASTPAERLRSLGFQPRARRLLLMCGRFLPIVFVGFVSVASALAPGYSDYSGTISDLAEQGRPHAAVMRAGIALGGVMIALFAIGFAPLLPRYRWGISGSLLAAGGATTLAAFFQDYGSFDGAPRNREGFLHNTCGLVAILATFAAMALVTLVAGERRDWNAMFRPTLWLAMLIAPCAAFFQLGPDNVQGLAQRAMYLGALVWLALLAEFALHLSTVRVYREPAADRPFSMSGHSPQPRTQIAGADRAVTRSASNRYN